MIAFVQPFSVAGRAGGARILRTLLRNAPAEWVSICTAVGTRRKLADREVWIPGRPLVRPIDRYVRLQRLLSSNLDLVYGGSLQRRLVSFCEENKVTAIHAIPHGIDFWYAYKAARQLGIRYYLNVHDELYYNLRGVTYLSYAMKRLAEVWAGSDGVFVISQAMGEEYNRRYGARDFVVVTDGLSKIATGPQPRPDRQLRVYMMGSAHISYRANFRVLLEGLERIATAHPELDVSLTMRGGFPYQNPTGTRVIELPWGTQSDVEMDLLNADVLYMPLPFEEQFAPLARFSLATKLVTYLGTGLPILYHGPSYAAAANLLRENQAAILVEKNDPVALSDSLLAAQNGSESFVNRALTLAREQFSVQEQRDKLWSTLLDSESSVVVSKTDR